MAMNYHDGSAVKLGDLVSVPVPSGTAQARVVMLGASHEHLDLDAQFLSWLDKHRGLQPTSLVLEWLGVNPFTPHDSPFATRGKYVLWPLDEHVQRVAVTASSAAACVASTATASGLIATLAMDVPVRARPSVYPEPYATQMAGRVKRVLGDLFGLKNFGVNLVTLKPGAISALRHYHTLQDEFIYVLSGQPTLHTNEGYTLLQAGMCAGFKAGHRNGHRLLNNSTEQAIYLEVGDRTPGDEGAYPDDDIKALQVDGNWVFVHWDGTPYT